MKQKIYWNLDDILKESEFDDYYQKTETMIGEIDGWVKKLSPNMSTKVFEEVMEFDENLGDRMSRLGYFPGLREEVNQKDQKAKLMKSKVDNLGLIYSKKARKIGHWLKGKEVEGLERLDDKNAKRLFGVIPELEYGLNYARLAAKHTLDEDKEDIVSNKDINGVSVLTDLRQIIETEFEYELEIDGKKQIIKNQAELMANAYSPDRKRRLAAYKAMLTKHKDNLDKFFAIYQAVVKDWGYEAKLRGYKSPISMRNFANHVPDEAIEILLTVCKKNTGIFQRYFEYKAKELGLKKLRREDIYAPLQAKTRNYTFDEAWKLVKETFDEFSPEFGKKGEKIVEERHVDVYPDENKRSGAFCATVTSKITPYILLNHTGEGKDVFTLAHELGHGIHSLYASKLPSSVQHSSLPLAETASTFGEMILFEKLFEKETDLKIKKSMLAEKIADSYASVIRQNYFVEFEIKAHEAISKGVTASDLGKMWMETLKDQFGESVEVDDQFENEWSYIPHIVQTPFYCYAYNFGELLSLALYRQYKLEGVTFVAKLESILAAGGSKDPDKVLKQVGVDMRDPEFWQKGFDVIDEWQKLLESL